MSHNNIFKTIMSHFSQLFDWARKHHNRVTISDQEIKNRAGKEFFRGIQIGFWDQREVDEAYEEGIGGN